jgi:SAM-dependent methyltransferase
MEAYPRLFARFKMKFDPMFGALAVLLAGERDKIKTILDIGCGYGVPGCWCLEHFPLAHVIALDPDPERVRVATLAMGERGTVTQGLAPGLPLLSQPADLVLLLDMLHYLDDTTITTLLTNCFQALAPNGRLVLRYVILPDTPPSKSWRLEDYRIRLSGGKPWYRSTEEMVGLMTEAGFVMETNMTSSSNNELIWMIGRAAKQ